MRCRRSFWPYLWFIMAVFSSPLRHSVAAETILLGFERSETDAFLSGKMHDACDMENTDGGYTLSRKKGDAYRIFPSWRALRGDSTHGDFALVRGVGKDILPSDGKMFQGKKTAPIPAIPEHVIRYYRIAPGDGLLLNTFHWGRKCMPTDWSKYRYFRMDAKSSGPGSALRVGLEDMYVEPPLVGVFDLPENRWVTIQIDLASARQKRGLRLEEMADFWVGIETAKKDTVFRLDNIRLSESGDVPKLEIIENPSFYHYAPPDRQAQWMPRGLAEPDRSPLERGEAITLYPPVPAGEEGISLRPAGWVTAYDNNRLFLAYSEFRGHRDVKGQGTPVSAMQTEDGGKTWTGLDGAPTPTRLWWGAALNADHGSGNGEPIDEQGDGMFMTSAGCCGLGYPSPRLFTQHVLFSGKGWDIQPVPALLDCDSRHCASGFSAVRDSMGGIWAASGQTSRMDGDVHVRCSPDNGLTWRGWQEKLGMTSAIPGSGGDLGGIHQYATKRVALTRYQKHVACFWVDNAGMKWSFFNGTAWSTPATVAEGTERYSELHATTLGDNEIFATVSSVSGVLHWDGGNWKREIQSASPAGCLTVCGEKVLFFSVEDGPAPTAWPITQSCGKSIHCWQYNRKTREWSGPRVVYKGEIPVNAYRGIRALVVPRYSPANFAPIAWTGLGQNWIKVLRVPVEP